MADRAKDVPSLLLDKMSSDADTTLVFDSENGKETLQAHATILKLHSPVLAQALELAPSNSTGVKRSSSSSDPAATRKLDMPGTSRADFLTMAQFLYPIVPLPKVSWDNLEVLLLEGRKWDMQVVLGHAAEFLQANAGSLTLDKNSPQYAFKWLQLADAACLTDACKACVNRIVDLDRSSCTAEALNSLSRQTLIYLVEKIAAPVNLSAVEKRCSSCGEQTRFRPACSRCGQYNSVDYFRLI